MGPDIAELRKNYERLDNARLIRLASEEAVGLRPEAVELIKQMIKERGLSADIQKAVDIQLKPVSEGDLQKYTNLLRKQPCPICGSTAELLNATMTAETVSFIIYTNYRKNLVIACPDCLDKQNNSASIRSALLGWWGLPWGIARTPQALLFNYKMKKQNHLSEANELFRSFVLQRAGRIEANKNNPEELQLMVKHIR